MPKARIILKIEKKGSEFMQEERKEVTIQDVINKRKQNARRVDVKLIMKAYNLAKEKHKDQKRSQ